MDEGTMNTDTRRTTIPADISFASPPAAFTFPEFCAAHRITSGNLQKLLRLGLGPRLMRVGNRNLISVEAARDWRARMEALTAERGSPIRAA
jgi:hypothetical protein